MWDEFHKDTSIAFTEAEQKSIVVSQPEIDLRRGEIIIFLMTPTDEHECPFGVGKVIDADDPLCIHFQWMGNPKYNPNATFRPAWFQKNDSTFYPRDRPIHRRHTWYTSDMKRW